MRPEERTACPQRDTSQPAFAESAAAAFKEEILSTLRAELRQSQVLADLRSLQAELSSTMSDVRCRMEADAQELLVEVRKVQAELCQQRELVPSAQVPSTVDLSPVVAEVRALKQDLDFSPILLEIQKSKVMESSASEELKGPMTDLDALARQVRSIASSVELLPTEIRKSQVDMGPVSEGLRALLDTPRPDLESFSRQVQSIASSVELLPEEILKSQADLGPVSEGIRALLDAPRPDLESLSRQVDGIASAVALLPAEIRSSKAQTPASSGSDAVLLELAALKAGTAELAASMEEARCAAAGRPTDHEPVLSELRLLRSQVESLQDTTGKLGDKITPCPSDATTGGLRLSFDVSHGADTLSGVGMSSIMSLGSACAVDLPTSRTLGDCVPCESPRVAASACADDEDLVDVGDLSRGIQCSQLDAALWELR